MTLPPAESYSGSNKRTQDHNQFTSFYLCCDIFFSIYTKVLCFGLLLRSRKVVWRLSKLWDWERLLLPHASYANVRNYTRWNSEFKVKLERDSLKKNKRSAVAFLQCKHVIIDHWICRNGTNILILQVVSTTCRQQYVLLSDWSPPLAAMIWLVARYRYCFGIKCYFITLTPIYWRKKIQIKKF